MDANSIYLASSSPRRKELLQQIGVPFQQISASINEDLQPDEQPLAYVRRLAQEKALVAWHQLRLQNKPMAPVLGSDTAVVVDGRILGKPRNEADAIEMLMSLSEKQHQVLTAVALVSAAGDTEQRVPDVALTHSTTEVWFRRIDVYEARDYWRTGEPVDKAGAYGIQGFGAAFVQSLSGSYSGVVGLPLFETANLLKQANISLWQRPENTAE